MSINRPSRVNSTNRVTGNLTVDADGLSAVVSGGDGNNTPVETVISILDLRQQVLFLLVQIHLVLIKELIPQQFHINLKEMELLVKL